MLYSALITLGTDAIQITDATYGVTTWPKGALARRLYVEPLRGNAAAAYVGLSNVTANGLSYAIQELAAPAVGLPLDSFEHCPLGDMRSFDPTPYYVHGTALDVLKISIWSD